MGVREPLSDDLYEIRGLFIPINAPKFSRDGDRWALTERGTATFGFPSLTQSQNVPFAGVVTVVEWTDGGRKSPSDRSSQSFDAFELFAVACRWICVTAILAL